jgi:hypothetical protein
VGPWVPRCTLAGVALNKVCNLEDWTPDRSATIRGLFPWALHAHPDFPLGMEHRKQWEYAQVLNGLASLGALRPDGSVLGERLPPQAEPSVSRPSVGAPDSGRLGSGP